MKTRHNQVIQLYKNCLSAGNKKVNFCPRHGFWDLKLRDYVRVGNKKKGLIFGLESGF